MAPQLRKKSKTETTEPDPTQETIKRQPGAFEKWLNDNLIGDNFMDRPFLQRLNFLHIPLLIGTPILGLIGLFTCPFNWKTYAFAYLYYFFTGVGITAGENCKKINGKLL